MQRCRDRIMLEMQREAWNGGEMSGQAWRGSGLAAPSGMQEHAGDGGREMLLSGSPALSAAPLHADQAAADADINDDRLWGRDHRSARQTSEEALYLSCLALDLCYSALALDLCYCFRALRRDIFFLLFV